MPQSPTERRSERGAVLVHVAVGLLALTGVSALVIDYGVMWVARGQAQTAADMAAHAGAVALSFDADPDNFGNTTSLATAIATEVAKTNQVIRQAPATATLNPSVNDCSGSGSLDCMTMEVFRNAEKSNKLPVFFGGLFGSTGGGAKARTTARYANGTGSDCFMPFVLPDKFEDWVDKEGKAKDGQWKSGRTFDLVCNDSKDGCKGKAKKDDPPDYVFHDPFPSPDVYVAPGAGGPGTGFKFTTIGTSLSDYGTKLDMDDHNVYSDPYDLMSGEPQPNSKKYISVFLERADGNNTNSAGPTGYENFQANITSCNGVSYFIGEDLPYLVGPSNEQTEANLNLLLEQDPLAKWDKSKRVTNSCAQDGTCVSKNGVSPRVMYVAFYDPQVLENCRLGKSPCSTPEIRIRISNMAGLFLDGMGKNLSDGKFKAYFVPMKAVTCTPDTVAAKKKKSKSFSCPDTSPDSFTRALTFYR